MGFLKTILSSIYNPTFYQTIKNKSLGSALKYFFLLILLLVFINTLILSYALGIKIPEEIRNFISQTISSIPPDSEVTIDEGQVSTNVAQPFFIPFPRSDNESKADSYNNILIIDTKTPFSAAQFGQYKTLFWLTKDSLFYQNREFDTRSIDLSKAENITINRLFLENLIGKANPWLGIIGPVLLILVFVGMFLGFTFNLVYFLFLAVLVFFLSSIFKWGLNYKASYKTTIYASTPAFFVDLILFNTGLYTGFFGFPFLFSLIALCITTINLQNPGKTV